MIIPLHKFKELSSSLRRGFVYDEIVLDIVRVMERKTEKREYNPRELYSKALDILIEGEAPTRLIQTCKSLRDNHLIFLPESLQELSEYFTRLSEKELIKTESYFPKC